MRSGTGANLRSRGVLTPPGPIAADAQCRAYTSAVGPTRPRAGSRVDRGMALVVVLVVLILVLAGGMAAVALTGGELSGVQGYKARAITEACADAAANHIRTLISANPSDPLPTNVTGTVNVNGLTLSYRMGHISGSAPAIEVVDGQFYDSSQMLLGENITNAGLTPAGVTVYRITGTCTDPTGGQQEVQLLVRHGVPSGG